MQVTPRGSKKLAGAAKIIRKDEEKLVVFLQLELSPTYVCAGETSFAGAWAAPTGATEEITAGRPCAESQQGRGRMAVSREGALSFKVNDRIDSWCAP